MDLKCFINDTREYASSVLYLYILLKTDIDGNITTKIHLFSLSSAGLLFMFEVGSYLNSNLEKKYRNESKCLLKDKKALKTYTQKHRKLHVIILIKSL